MNQEEYEIRKAVEVNVAVEAASTEQLERRKQLATALGQLQKGVSVAEFFQKNMHLLGFENRQRALAIFLRETIDNALDACESAEIRPNIDISVTRISKDLLQYRIVDCGPGIEDSKVGDVFCRLLFGSKFGVNEQKRGSQGIGVASCGLYSQVTTGEPIEVFCRSPGEEKTRYYKLEMDVFRNRAHFLQRKTIPHLKTHGVEVRMKLKATYLAAGRRGIPAYLKLMHIVNPFLQMSFTGPDGDVLVFNRRSDAISASVPRNKPHISGIEFGTFEKALLRATTSIEQHLIEEIYGVSTYLLTDLMESTGVDVTIPASLTTNFERQLIYAYLRRSNFVVPQTGVSLIGFDALKYIMDEWETTGEAAFTTYATSSYGLLGGAAFCVEGVLAYGGSQTIEGKVQLLRAVNRSPLIAQQSACAITRGVCSFNWNHYSKISHCLGDLPSGPLILFIHVAGGKMCYTSEEKAALADMPELRPKILELLRKLGRNLAAYQNKERAALLLVEKFDVVKQHLPVIYKTCETVSGKKLGDHLPVISQILDTPVYTKRDGEYVVYNGCKTGAKILDRAGNAYELEPGTYRKFSIDVLWHPTIMYPLFMVNFERDIARDESTFKFTPWNKLVQAAMTTSEKLSALIQNVCYNLAKGEVPSIALRSRQSNNLIEAEAGYWTLSDRMTVRDIKRKRSALVVTRLLKLAQFFLMQLAANKRSSLREIYYISEGWGRAVKFNEQAESDQRVEELEVITNRPRESFGVYAEERGHAFGDVVLQHLTRNGYQRHQLLDSSGAGYSIPFDVDTLRFIELNVKFILCIEGSAMYRRLKDQNFHQEANCLLISLTGQPPRSTRLFVKRLAEQFNVPVLMFVDCDGWSQMIAATMSIGAIKTSHMSEFLTCTSAKILGVTIYDILAYNLPTDVLNKRDKACLTCLIHSNRFASPAKRAELSLQLQHGVKSEQQAFAKYGLPFVVRTYLPRKLHEQGLWPKEVPEWELPTTTEDKEEIIVQ